MAAAIPAAIGLGGSLFSGISGKKAAKEAKKQQERMMQMVMPLIQAQIAAKQEAVTQGKDLLGQTRPYLEQGAGGLSKAIDWWKPLMSGDQRAIDQFLAPERRAINEGYRQSQESITRFAPRGGGRVSSLARADIGRQGQLSDLTFGARRQAVDSTAGLSDQIAKLGLGGIAAGSSLLGSTGNDSSNVLGMLVNQSQNTSNQANAGMGALGNSLGSFLSQIFKPKSGGSYGGSTTGGVANKWSPS